MSVRRVLVALVLAALVAAGAIVLLRDTGGRDVADPSASLPTRGGPLAADTAVTPRVVLFGDTVSASVDVTFDPRLVVADSVRFAPKFASWGAVAPPVSIRRTSAETAHLRTTYTLRCIISPCVPQRSTASLEFDPVRVTYRRTNGAKPETAEARWPVLVVHSQIVSDDFARPGAGTSPWRADAATLPPASYRVSPGLARAAVLGIGALLALVGIVLAVLAIPPRAPIPEREPEPQPEPEPLLPPLEHALVLLEAEAHANGAADRRRALELIAEEMEARGEMRIARRARGMAWSEDVPVVSQTRSLAGQVRGVLAAEEPEPPVDLEQPVQLTRPNASVEEELDAPSA